MATDVDQAGVVIVNPVSGSGDHAERVRGLAADHGFSVRETESGGDVVAIARDAADVTDRVVACGGDGTVNGVVTGLLAAGALDDVTLGVVPAGTGNNFAENIGVEGIDHAFEVLAGGETRRLDLGLASPDGDRTPPGPASDWPFVNSCICGLTADASDETTTESKSRLGALAYVVETLRTAVTFEGLPLSVVSEGDDVWEGDALLLLVGNARRFPAEGRTQANVEDGQFDVTVIEERPTVDLASDAVASRLVGEDASYLRRLWTPELTVGVHDGETTFSLDGEMLSAQRLVLRTLPGALSVQVGEAYEAAPD